MTLCFQMAHDFMIKKDKWFFFMFSLVLITVLFQYVFDFGMKKSQNISAKIIEADGSHCSNYA